MGAMNNNRFALIIEGCRRHDRAFQKELYQLFYQYTLSVSLNYASSQEEAREIVNDVFLKVFAKIDQYNPEQSFKPWLNKITVYTAIDYYRKHIKNEIQTDDLEIIGELSDPCDILAQISAEELRDLVQQLSPACRTAINLYAIEGYEHHEIAAILGISVGASKSNLFKARAKLKHMLHKRACNKSSTNPQ
jgi:RNA polymerase sigma-70 factor (ECF subfamily)